MSTSQPIEFRGNALDDLRAFPVTARREAGYQLDQVQHGLEPDDWETDANGWARGPRNSDSRHGRCIPDYLYCEICRCCFCVALFSEKNVKDQKDRPRRSRKTLQRFNKGAWPMNSKKFACVWDALEDTPEEAENMKLRSALIMALKQHIVNTGLNQSEAAKLFGVTQPRISDLTRGKINLFALDALVNMAAAAGLHVEMRVLETA